jgi:hypothetical protein
VISRYKHYFVGGDVIRLESWRQLMFGIILPDDILRTGLRRPGRYETQFEVTNEKILVASERLNFEGHSHVVVVYFTRGPNGQIGFENREMDQELDISSRSEFAFIRTEQGRCFDQVMAESAREQTSPNVMMFAEAHVVRDHEYQLRSDPYRVKILIVSPPVEEQNRRLPMLRAKIFRLLDFLISEEITSVVVGIFDCQRTRKRPQDVALALRECFDSDGYAKYFEKIVLSVTNEKDRSGFESVFGGSKS